MNKIAILAGFLLSFSFSTDLWAQQPGTSYTMAAEDAAWCWFSDPRAVYHKGKSEKMYFGYINSKGDVLISSREKGSPVSQTFVLHEKLQIDDHNVPSILFLPDGKLMVFYTEHSGRFFSRKSKNPEDIGSWEEERVIPFGGNKICYSHPVMLKNENNRIYMFWRGSDWRPTLAYSDDLGETWSATKPLFDSVGRNNRPYLKVASNNKDRIDFLLTDGHPAVEATNSVYHLYYKNGRYHQTNGDLLGTDAALPLSRNQVRKVYDGKATGARAWISDITLDKGDRPIIVYNTYPAQTDHRYHYAFWNGTQWNSEELCKAGGWMPILKQGEKNTEPYYSGGLSLDHNNPSNVYLSRSINGIFEIEHWIKGTKVWSSTRLTDRSSVGNVRPYVVANAPRKQPIVLWMSGIYNHYTRFDTDLRIIGF